MCWSPVSHVPRELTPRVFGSILRRDSSWPGERVPAAGIGSLSLLAILVLRENSNRIHYGVQPEKGSTGCGPGRSPGTAPGPAGPGRAGPGRAEDDPYIETCVGMAFSPHKCVHANYDNNMHADASPPRRARVSDTSPPPRGTGGPAGQKPVSGRSYLRCVSGSVGVVEAAAAAAGCGAFRSRSRCSTENAATSVVRVHDCRPESDRLRL
ncbi:hypothetical protein EYF80_062952 [Liparis tanakae]|uniref:Uncharacterized protein n=1 Tax=Liparis tanakae TaxID=230148 RepID=A0A4Z2EDR6_9TELE|nr:hypothetical protein EYF80_062952 [Liparis tanakae]